MDDKSSSLLLSDGTGINLNVHYVRTEYVHNDKYSNSPNITVVSSKNDLQNYYEKNVPGNNFFDVIKKYSDNYFSDNILLIIDLVEGSGSIRHKVKKIEENGTIVIKRLLPEMGTSDMAAWSIIIELAKSLTPKQYRIVLVDKNI
jgi:hypothetical protein